LKNEGDLNNDGNDEVSFVVNFDDHSTVNTCLVYTYRRKQWQKLLSFSIWEWKIAEKPLLRKNKNGTVTIFTSDDEANAIEKNIRLN
jgi:hypothetical protein